MEVNKENKNTYFESGWVEPTQDSEPLYSNAVHTPEMWENIGNFLSKQKAEDWKDVVGSKGIN